MVVFKCEITKKGVSNLLLYMSAFKNLVEKSRHVSILITQEIIWWLTVYIVEDLRMWLQVCFYTCVWCVCCLREQSRNQVQHIFLESLWLTRELVAVAGCESSVSTAICCNNIRITFDEERRLNRFEKKTNSDVSIMKRNVTLKETLLDNVHI